MTVQPSPLAPSLALAALLVAFPPPAEARAEPGTEVENVELRTLAGGRERLLGAKAKANVLVFFRTGHDRSLDALRQLARCERELAAKPVRWAAIVSAGEPAAEVRAAVEEAGLRMPVLLDDGDALYGRLAVRLHPMIALVDGRSRLLGLEPYRRIDTCEIVKVRIRVLLGEADEAALERALHPAASPLPGADPAKKAMRDVNMARRLLEIGQLRDAVRFAEKALAIAPLPEAFAVMGQAYTRLGRCPEAARAFEEALRLDPASADAAAGKAAGCR